MQDVNLFSYQASGLLAPLCTFICLFLSFGVKAIYGSYKKFSNVYEYEKENISCFRLAKLTP